MKKRFWASAAAALVATLGGCASEIMKDYVGKSLTQPILDYGSPQDAFDLENGNRAFIWSMQHSYTTPGYASTTGTYNETGRIVGSGGYATYQSSGIYNASTTYRPPTTTVFECNYVLYAKPNGYGGSGPAAWTVVGFKPPSLGCQ